MMQSEWVLIRFAAVLAVMVLPFISANSVAVKRQGPAVRRYPGCLVAYAIAIGLVEAGYVIQGLITDALRLRSFYTGWHWLRTVFSEYRYFLGFEEIALIGCIIAFAALFAQDGRSRAVTSFRAAFVTYTSFDLLNGMMAG